MQSLTLFLITGLYECTLSGRVMNFFQKGTVTGDEIRQAPIVRLQSKVNVKCEEGKIQPLKCCVQSSYGVQWFRGTALLSSSKYELTLKTPQSDHAEKLDGYGY